MHVPSLYTVSAASLVELAALIGNFNDGDRASVQGLGSYIYGPAVAIPPVGSVVSVVGGTWTPDVSVPVFESTMETEQPAMPGVLNYRLPLGNYVANNPADMRVFHTAPGGPMNELFFGADWSFYTCGMYNPPYAQPATVSDMATGVAIAGVPPPGVITLRWIERSVAISPRLLSPARVVAGAFDNLVAWQTATPFQPNPLMEPRSTNAIIVPPPPPGFEVEIWRMTKRQGGHVPTAQPHFFGGGRRFVPFFRGTQPGVMPNTYVFFNMVVVLNPDPNLNSIQLQIPPPFGIAAGQAAVKRRYKFCYYNPTLRARSGFADETVVMRAGWSGDQHNNSLPLGGNTFRQFATVTTSAS